MAATHVLFESSSGYALFESKLVEEIGAKDKDVQKSIQDLHKFGKMVQLKSFVPFKSAAHALENANDVSEGILNDYLKNMLELNLSGAKSSKKSSSSVILGVSDKNLASSIAAALSIQCDTSPRSLELVRGVRMHAEKLLGGLQTGDITRAQLGLGHSYSRSKVKFNVNRSDNMIIQAIATIDQLDKDVNTFSMRMREWYGYTFPELSKLIPDNLTFAKAAHFIGSKEKLDESKLEELTEILDGNDTLAKNVLDAARSSMGTDLNELDAINIHNFAKRVVDISEYRKRLITYLSDKMNLVAPSLTSLIGERIGARLISHAGSLTNLSKYPASTVQILGAEKALFRALKTKGNTPKYGLIYHSTFIGRAGAKHKGRISRFLANKCSIASRIDCYSDTPTNKFGEALRNQVEERLTFFETGTAPSKNSDTMKRVLDNLAMDADDEDSDVEMADTPARPLVTNSDNVEKEKKKDKKKRKSDVMDIDGEEEVSPKKKKKEKGVEGAEDMDKVARKAAKKAAKAAKAAADATAVPLPQSDSEASPKKTSKKNKSEGNGEPEPKKRRKSKAE